MVWPTHWCSARAKEPKSHLGLDDGWRLMPKVSEQPGTACETSRSRRTAAVAWVVAAVYYFYQYALRSSPSVMMSELSKAFGLTSLGVASIVGLFYYGYSPFSLVAGAAMDRLGPRKVLPIGAIAVGIGALLFATGSREAASVGRILQGAGGVFALVGAIYIATKNFPASQAATLIGGTQMFGMAGGAAGQFAPSLLPCADHLRKSCLLETTNSISRGKFSSNRAIHS